MVTFGDDCGVVTLEFVRNSAGLRRHGRQSQFWRKFDDGWKIVSAHVSFMAQSYMDFAAAHGAPAHPVRNSATMSSLNLDRSAVIAKPMLDFPLGDQDEAAPVFEP